MRLHSLQKTFLMVISALSIIGCAGFPKYPARPVYRPLISRNVCLKFNVVKSDTISFSCEKGPDGKCVQLPLSECDGIIGYKAEDVPIMNDWGRDVIKYADKHCKGN
jgi:hypothetical protein